MVPGFELRASHVLSELTATESHAQLLDIGALRYLFRGEFFSTSGKFPSGRKLLPDSYEEQTMHSDQ